MAIVHTSATIRPTKAELLETELGGAFELLGSYRFDDPAGEVGVEAFVVRRGTGLRHVVLTYRGAPLPSGQARLVSTMEHTVLGDRWVYDGTTDPVAIGCFRRAALGEQDQAELEMWEDGRAVGVREPTVRLTPRPADVVSDALTLQILREPAPDGQGFDGQGLDGPGLDGPGLVASWDGGAAVVARFGG